MIDSQRINEVVSAMGEASWKFVGVLNDVCGLFQCWIRLDGKIYCLSYGREWDAVETRAEGVSSGAWNADLTAKLRQASE